MESMEFSCSVFRYSFWVLVGVPKAHGEDLSHFISFLFKAGADADRLWADALVLRPSVCAVGLWY